MSDRRTFDTDLPEEGAEPSLDARLARSSVEADAIADHLAPEGATDGDDAVGAVSTAGTPQQTAGTGRLGEGQAFGTQDRAGRMDDVAAAYGTTGVRAADETGNIPGAGTAQGADAGSGLAEDPDASALGNRD